MKEFFKIEKPYTFEWNDLRAFISTLNVVLVIIFGLAISWFGLSVAVFGLVKDLTKDRHINGTVMHSGSIALNLYFLYLLYFG